MQLHATRGASLRLFRAGFVHVPNDRFVPSRIAREIVDDAISGAIAATIEELSDAEHAEARALSIHRSWSLASPLTRRSSAMADSGAAAFEVIAQFAVAVPRYAHLPQYTE